MLKIKRKPVRRSTKSSSLAGPRAITLSKCIPILAMLPPLLLSIALISFQSHVILGSWRLRISENLSAISALKQVVAGVMGTLQASAIVAIVFNFPTRTRLAHPTESVKLDTLGLLSALSVPRMDWSLPKKNWPLILLAIGLGHGPAALWASAITPLPTTRSTPGGSILVPSYPEASANWWNQEFNHNETFGLGHCSLQRQSTSFVTNCPIPYHQNALLNSAQQATAPDGTPRNHSKLDSPAWTYQGRSYGAGSSIGLTSSTSSTPVDFQLVEFSFEETGYNASVHCNRVDETDDDLRFKYEMNQGELAIFRLKGHLPNMTKFADDPIIAWCHERLPNGTCEHPERRAMFAWYAEMNDHGQYMVGIRANSWYEEGFNHIQCSLEFVPTVFSVFANITDLSINVTPHGTTTTELDSTGSLLNNTVLSLEFLSKMTSSLYVSVLGEAFLYNLNTPQQGSSMTRSEAGIIAAEASFEAILDNILGVYASGQILINYNATNAPIQGTFIAFNIGTPLTHILTLLLNLLIILWIMVEGIRTRFWRDLPRYDILDFKSTVTAASFGGKDISRHIQRQYEGKDKSWEADPGDRKLGEIEVCLLQTESDEPRIILHNDGLLTQTEVDGSDGMEMDESTEPFERAPSFKGAPYNRNGPKARTF